VAAGLAVALLPAAAGVAEAKRPKCFGERATLVYDRDDGYAPGTRGDDVIVVRGFPIATEGMGGDDLICVRRGGPVPLIDGGPGDDVIDAGPNGAFVGGGGGNDVIHGGGGDEFIYADRGNDRYRGGRGDDAIDYGDAERRVRVDLAAGVAIQHGQRDGLAGIESVWGTRFGDTLVGDDDRNVLIGGNGADVLSGLDGHDLLRGLDGEDVADGGASRDRCDAEEMSSCERRFPPPPLATP
jgi:Ca2+-binding RTX toxin-like protein